MRVASQTIMEGHFVDITRAFSYAFDQQDKEWTSKLAILAMIAFASIVTTPLLIGLVGWALILGYYVDLVRNLRDGHPTPLPRWDRCGTDCPSPAVARSNRASAAAAWS